MTVQQILLNWIETALAMAEGPVRIRSSDIESKCARWGERVYQRTHLVSTYRRAWRKLREGRQIKLRNRGVHSVIKLQDKPQGIWNIIPQQHAVVTNHETKQTRTIKTQTT